MKRILGYLTLCLLLALSVDRAQAQEDQGPPPGPSDQAPPPDQQGMVPDQGAPQDQGAPDQGGDPGVSYQTFYDNLSNQGTWVQTNDYGYAFQPNVSDPNWAPYTDGRWVYTDQGWTWLSDEPWGWATYHYGRWANIDGTGWVWIPGYRWAPAWVSWRYGGGYCGWAPLPPETFVGVEYGGRGGRFGGYHYGGDVDVSFNIGPGYYNFVPIGRMGDRNVGRAVVNRYNNYSIINRTTNITNINVGRGAGRNGFGGVMVNGPSLNEVNAHSSQHIQTMRLAQSNRPGLSSVNGNAVSVYAPRVNSATAHQGRPGNVSRTIANPTFNRGNSLNRPLAVTANVRPAAPSAAVLQRAQRAQAHIPASANIDTARTPVHSAHINGAQPVTQTRANTTENEAAHVNGNSTFHAQAPANHVDRAATGTGYRPQTRLDHPSRQNEIAPANAEVRHTEAAPSYNPQVQQTHHTEAAPMARENEVRHMEAQPAQRQHEENRPAVSQHAAQPHAEAHAAAPHPAAAHTGPGGGGRPPGKDDKKP